MFAIVTIGTNDKQTQGRRQKFSEGDSFDTAGGLGVYGSKSCNLAISRHFIQTVGKPCFPLLIFKDTPRL